MKTPDAILTADLHEREDQPVCRTDNSFVDTLLSKLLWLKCLQEKYQCPVINAGDVGNHWKMSPWMLSQLIINLPDDFWSCLGNHDLPQHNLELVHKCAFNTLTLAKKIKPIHYHWGERAWPDHLPEKPSLIIKGRRILVWHVMVWLGEEPWPNCEDPNAEELLKALKDFDLIVTGHNHRPFITERKGRLLVNPGSLSRQKANETHSPRVYLWWADENRVKPVYVPINDDVITRGHIDKEVHRDNRLEAFVTRLETDWEVGLSYEENLKRFERENLVRRPVMDIVRRAGETNA
jgi:predicted phosphodiesterase